MHRLKLLLIGASVFQQKSQGVLTSKRLVVDYVEGFRHFFNQVTWATTLFKGKAHTQAVVNEEKVIPCILNGRPKGLLSDYLKLRRVIDRDTVVFLHLPNPWLTLVVLVLKKRAKALFTYIAGDYIRHSEISKQIRGRIYSKLYKIIYELPIRFADGAVTRGELNLKRAQRLNRNVIKTVPIGLMTVLHHRKKEPLSNNSVRLLYVGKLDKGKGVDVLLKAFANLCMNLVDRSASLTVVGTGPEEVKLKKLAKSLEIGEKVVFLGFIDNKEFLSKLYAESDILIVPSTYYPEGVPRVIDEAILHKTLVMASALPTICEEFSNGEVILFPPGEESNLVNVLKKLIYNTKFRQESIKKMEQSLLRRNQMLDAAEQHSKFIINSLIKEVN